MAADRLEVHAVIPKKKTQGGYIQTSSQSEKVGRVSGKKKKGVEVPADHKEWLTVETGQELQGIIYQTSSQKTVKTQIRALKNFQKTIKSKLLQGVADLIKKQVRKILDRVFL